MRVNKVNKVNKSNEVNKVNKNDWRFLATPVDCGYYPCGWVHAVVDVPVWIWAGHGWGLLGIGRMCLTVRMN